MKATPIFAHSNSRNNYGILIYGNYLYPAYSAGRFSAWTYHLENAACRFYYPGKATTQAGKFRVGDTIGVVYLPANPAKYAIADTRGGFTAMLIFCIILFLFVLFAVYKINGMVQRGEM